MAATACWIPAFDGNAQQKPAGDAPQAAASGEDAPLNSSGPESTEAAARARQRRRAQITTTALLKMGDKNVSLLAAILKSTGHDYKEIGNVKEGEVLQLTRSQAIKLKTDLNLTFGDLTLKTENVAKGYAGVYSVWLKKTAAGWSFVFNEKPDVWGTMYDASANVGEIPVEYTAVNPPTEALAFALTQEGQGGVLKITWGQHQWSAKFTFAQ
jgi:hypothetical protein